MPLKNNIEDDRTYIIFSLNKVLGCKKKPHHNYYFLQNTTYFNWDFFPLAKIKKIALKKKCNQVFGSSVA